MLMLRAIPLPYKIAAIAIAVVAVFSFGFIKGQERATAKFEKARIALQEELFDLSEDLSNKNRENLRLAQEREELIHDLETQALEAPGADNPGVGSDGLSRLHSRWGRSSKRTSD